VVLVKTLRLLDREQESKFMFCNNRGLFLQNASEHPANLQKQESSVAERCRSDDGSEIYADTKFLMLIWPARQQSKNVIVASAKRESPLNRQLNCHYCPMFHLEWPNQLRTGVNRFYTCLHLSV